MSRLMTFAIASVVGACSPDGRPTAPPPPSTASVRVQATTTGADPDANGYVIRVDQRGTMYRVATNGDITIDRLLPGLHHVSVADLAPNCTASATEFTITVAAGDTPTLDLRVSCIALGAIQVAVATTGDEIDATGYSVTAYGARSDVATTNVGVSATVVLPRIAPGTHSVVIHNVAANCELPSGSGSRTVEVLPASTATVDFSVICKPATELVYSAEIDRTDVEIYAIRSNGTQARQLTHHPARDEDPAWSPDGSRIAFTSDRGGVAGIHVMTASGDDVTRLTPVGTASYRPAWSPDGSRLVFVGERDGNADVYVINADGSGQLRLTNEPGRDTSPSWSPDGSRIAFESDRAGTSEIFVMQADGSGVTRLTTNDVYDGQPDWSPSGDRIAFARSVCPVAPTGPRCHPSTVVMDVGTRSSIAVGDGGDPAWSPDGTRIAATGFACDIYSWYYYGLPCQVAGIRILAPVAPNAFGQVATWDPVLTTGVHANPSWRR